MKKKPASKSAKARPAPKKRPAPARAVSSKAAKKGAAPKRGKPARAASARVPKARSEAARALARELLAEAKVPVATAAGGAAAGRAIAAMASRSASGKRPAVVGRRLRKLDGLLKATGQAVYADDIQLPRMLHCKILRSPHAHARIKRIDFTRCLAAPGVLAVLEGSEMPGRYGVIPWTPDEQALAVDKVRFIGDEVAAVAAVDELAAEEALGLIDVEYELLPALVDPEASLAEQNVKIHESAKRGNVSKHVDLAFGDVPGALERSAAVAEGEFFYAGSTHTPIEPHCAVGHYDAEGNLTVWSSTQIPHYVHRELQTVRLPSAS